MNNIQKIRVCAWTLKWPSRKPPTKLHIWLPNVPEEVEIPNDQSPTSRAHFTPILLRRTKPVSPHNDCLAWFIALLQPPEPTCCHLGFFTLRGQFGENPLVPVYQDFEPSLPCNIIDDQMTRPPKRARVATSDELLSSFSSSNVNPQTRPSLNSSSSFPVFPMVHPNQPPPSSLEDGPQQSLPLQPTPGPLPFSSPLSLIRFQFQRTLSMPCCAWLTC